MKNDSESERKPPSWLVFSLLFFGAYTEIGITIGNVYIPSFFSIVLCLVSLLIARPKFYKHDLRCTILFIGFVLTSVYFAPNYKDIGSRFVGALQISIAFICFVLSAKILSKTAPKNRSILSIWILRLLVLLTATEYFGITTQISDEFRYAFYANSNYGLYQADIRDLSLGNFIRPKVFTTEPSLVAVGFFILISGAVANLQSKLIAIELLLYIFLEYYFLNSPIIFLSLLAFIWILANRLGLFVYGVAILVLGVSFIFLGDLITERMSRLSIDRILETQAAQELKNESSERLRLVNPYVAVIDTFRINPFTGLGISGKRSLELYSTVSPDYEQAFGNNAFASIFIYFGLIGSVVFGLIIYTYLKRYIAHSLILFVTVALFMQAMGGFETVRLWMYLGFLASFFFREDKNDTPRKSHRGL